MEGYNVLVTEANSELGLQFVQQLVSLPQPPSNIFATHKTDENLEGLAKIQNLSKKSRVILNKMDTNHEKDMHKVKAAIEEHVGNQGLGLVININCFNSEAENPTDCLKNHFLMNVVPPLRLFKIMLPLLESAAAWLNKKSDLEIPSCFLNITDDKAVCLHIFPEISKIALNLALTAMEEEIGEKQVLVYSSCLNAEEIINEDNSELVNCVRKVLLDIFFHVFRNIIYQW